jgi:hypothetical protein
MGQIHKLYVNGVDVSAPQTDGNVNNIAGYTANQPMDLGGLSDANAPALCDLDGVNMWNKALTQSEITELYNSGNGAQYITDSFYKPTTNDALNTNNGTAQGGLTYVPGKVGTAFQFNGTNSYIQLPQYSMRFTNSFSISCWTYTTANQTGYKTLIGDYYYSGGDYGYTISISSANKVSVFVVGAGGTPYGFNSNITLSNNQWNNIAVVWDKANTNLKLYVNGTLDTSLTTALASTITYAAGSNRTNIGTSNSSPTSGIGAGVFNGLIDAINVWDKVLTVSEITELYNSANGKQYPN